MQTSRKGNWSLQGMQTSEKVIGHNKVCRPPEKAIGHGKVCRPLERVISHIKVCRPPTSPEWAVKSHGCDMKSLRLVRGFHVVPVDRAIKTIIGYDLNLSD